MKAIINSSHQSMIDTQIGSERQDYEALDKQPQQPIVEEIKRVSNEQDTSPKLSATQLSLLNKLAKNQKSKSPHCSGSDLNYS